MFKMTKAAALAKQAEQVARYARTYPMMNVADIVANATTADALAEGEHDIVVINRHIPRGAAIEMLLGRFEQQD
jgi:hypothetical protein